MVLDLHAEEVLVLGAGRMGALTASSLLLTSEADWCQRERDRLERHADLGERAKARLEDDPELCDADLAAELMAIDADAHDPERRTLSFDVCAGPDCAWSDVPVGETLAVPWTTGETRTFGRYVVWSEGPAPRASWWDAEACGTTDDYAEAAASLAQVWTVDDGTLTFDTVTAGGAAKGSFAADLEPDEGDVVGTAEGAFHATPCALDVPVYLSL